MASGHRLIPMAQIIGIYAGKSHEKAKELSLSFLHAQEVLDTCGADRYHRGMSLLGISGILRTPKCKRVKCVSIVNNLPFDWSDRLKSSYPKRSGPCGWIGTRLMLALRRALMDFTWEQIINGCENYRTYCRDAGIEGTDFVQSPLRFISEGSFAEEFLYKAPEDPKVTEAKLRAANRDVRAAERGNKLGLVRDHLESIGAFETRCMLAETIPAPSDVRGRISSLTDRMRVSK
jgi:hypothetical protein